ncbi:hypothetical protein HU200_062301 [Digitaria exilis]|uniref:protein-serine/threonine phosphatase n=1 Tax=Digitaria exilis TaxID=1010633 RepID=A0A835A5Z1_9POAL|nr:hypothetical protein HU200_062301 [Digitaria exilis]
MGASNSRETSTTAGGENVRFKYASASMQGFGAEMEDAYAVLPDLDQTTSFFGLYDGHGGAEVALLCAKLFHVELQVHPNYHENLDIAIRRMFSRMDELLLQSEEWRTLVKPTGDSRSCIQHIFCPIVNPWYCTEETPYIPPENTGSSVSVAVTRGNQIIIANVGDSHCVASSHGQAIQLSIDHHPSDPDERQRIERAGGKIDTDNRVVREAGRVNAFTMILGMLATSRAIGDFVFKQNNNLPPEEQMVICDPDILSMEITNDIEFLVIASRGIWASLSRQAVVDFVHDELQFGETDLRLICERLVAHAQPTVFDTTVILIQFKHAAADEAVENQERVRAPLSSERQACSQRGALRSERLV